MWASSWNRKVLFGHCGRGLDTSQQAGKPTGGSPEPACDQWCGKATPFSQHQMESCFPVLASFGLRSEYSAAGLSSQLKNLRRTEKGWEDHLHRNGRL